MLKSQGRAVDQNVLHFQNTLIAVPDVEQKQAGIF